MLGKLFCSLGLHHPLEETRDIDRAGNKFVTVFCGRGCGWGKRHMIENINTWRKAPGA